MTSALKNDKGETLVETLLSLVLIAIVGTALLTATGALIRYALVYKAEALAGKLVRDWAEDVSAISGTTSYHVGSPPTLTVPSGGSVTSVKYWNGTDFVTTAASDKGVQKITLKVTVPNGALPSGSSELEVVVRQ